MSCPAWRPDCQVRDAAGTAQDAFDAARDVAGFASSVGRFVAGSLDVAGKTWGAFGRVTDPIGGPLVGLAGLWILFGLWILWRLFGGAKQAAPALIKGYTGVDINEVRSPRKAGYCCCVADDCERRFSCSALKSASFM